MTVAPGESRRELALEHAMRLNLPPSIKATRKDVAEGVVKDAAIFEKYLKEGQETTDE